MHPAHKKHKGGHLHLHEVAALLVVAFVVFRSLGPSGEAPLSEEKYTSLRDELVAVAKTQSPSSALAQLATETERSQQVLNACHNLVHEIGHVAYEQYGLAKALEFQSEICGAGYIHGVVEAHVVESGAPISELAATCDGFEGNPARANCFHGLGHGLMDYSANDTPASLSVCNELPSPADSIRCAEGVFMEYFDRDETVHPAQQEEDLFAQCRASTLPYQKGACYFYAPQLFLNENPAQYATMFAKCGETEEGFKRTCVEGTASRATKENIRNLPTVLEVCRRLGSPADLACVEGVGSYHFTHFGDKEKTQRMCGTLPEEYQVACAQTLSR